MDLHGEAMTSDPSSPTTIHIDDSEIDDILYFARVNEQHELLELISDLARKHDCTARAVLYACVDPDSGNTPIHFCAANGLTDLLRELLDLLRSSSARADKTCVIDRRNTAGNTALHWAALNGHVETAKLLVQAGAELWARNRSGNLAIFEAERAGKDDVVAYLLRVGGAAEGEDVDRTVGGEDVGC